MTPLRNAAIEGNVEEVRRILEQNAAGVQGRFQTGSLNSVLHNAVARGHEKVVDVLLSKGANIEATNSEGQTPIFIAVQHNFAHLVNLLVDRGADLQAEDNAGNTPLHLAASTGRTKMIKLLLSLGADKHAENDEGEKPIDVISFSYNDEAAQALQD